MNVRIPDAPDPKVGPMTGDETPEPPTERTRRPRKPTGPTLPEDPELAAMQVIVGVLEPLVDPARQRVLAYLRERFNHQSGAPVGNYGPGQPRPRPLDGIPVPTSYATGGITGDTMFEHTPGDNGAPTIVERVTPPAFPVDTAPVGARSRNPFEAGQGYVVGQGNGAGWND